MSKSEECTTEISISTLGMLIMLICLGGGLFMAAVTQPSDVKYVRDSANKCVLLSKVITEGRMYCGKACTTEKYRHVWQCPGRSNLTIDYYDMER